MNRRKIKNRIAFKIWTAVPRVEKYAIGAAAIQILETIRPLFHNDSFATGQKCDDSCTRGQPPISVTGHWRILSYVHTYFFISANKSIREDVVQTYWVYQTTTLLDLVTFTSQLGIEYKRVGQRDLKSSFAPNNEVKLPVQLWRQESWMKGIIALMIEY